MMFKMGKEIQYIIRERIPERGRPGGSCAFPYVKFTRSGNDTYVDIGVNKYIPILNWAAESRHHPFLLLNPALWNFLRKYDLHWCATYRNKK